MSLLSVPLKTILMYHADLQNETLPFEYAYCDGSTLNASQQDINPGGTYTVPDLRNRFLLGADRTLTAGTAGAAVGSSNIELASGAPGPKGTGGENDHQLVTAELASHVHGGIPQPGPDAGAGGTLGAKASSGNEQTDSAGGDQSHENRPRYYGVVYIMKVKN